MRTTKATASISRRRKRCSCARSASPRATRRAITCPRRFLTEGAFCDVADSRAHAWVEIYSPGLGWVPFEATPGYSAVTTPDKRRAVHARQFHIECGGFLLRSPGEQRRFQAETESAPASQAASAPSSTASAAPAAPGQAIPEDGVRNVLSLLAFFGLLAAVVFGRHLFVQRRREAAFRPDTNAAVVAMFAYLKRLESHGGRTPAGSGSAWARRRGLASMR